MRKLQVLGVHHITLTGADRQTTIDFWEGVLGMPFIFDQPNLDDPEQGRATFGQVPERLKARGIGNSGVKDRGFMDSIYFKDPCGLLIELACYKFIPPRGSSHAAVLMEAHKIRVAAGDDHIAEVHLADAVERIVERSQESLSKNREPKNPY